MMGWSARWHIKAPWIYASLFTALVLASPPVASNEAGEAVSADEDVVGALIQELSAEPNYEDIEVVLIVAKAPSVIVHEDIAQALEYVSEAALHFDNGDPERAATMASLAIDSGMLTRRDLAMVYRNRGVAQVALESVDDAIADFSSAVTYRPDYAPGYAARAAALIRKGDFDAALVDLDKALDLDPTLAAASYNRYLLKQRAGEDSSAAFDLLQAHLADPENDVYLKEAQSMGLIHRPPTID